jgi:REP element-mobilizing transposase RayT
VDANEPRNRRSVRLKAFDYASPGAYFVTIVTHGRAMLFGRIVEREMRLSKVGTVADRAWREIPEHFPHVELGSFVVMPNHVHGILVLHAPTTPNEIGSDATASEPGRGTIYRAPTEQFGAPRIGSIPTIVGTYKAAVTRAVGRLPGDRHTIWQRNYYEHVIRDDADWDRIRGYIDVNTMNWEEDEENPRNAAARSRGGE